MTIEIRKAEPKDSLAILEISSQIWEGTDYVPRVLDKWMNSKEGTLWCALFNQKVLGFSRSTYLSSRRCWLEGIRVSPEARGKGIGKALAVFQIEDAFNNKGFDSCGLSSYIENYESLHIVRTHGFSETALFKIYDWAKESIEGQLSYSKDQCQNYRKEILSDCKVSPLTVNQKAGVIEAMERSETLKLRKGYLSYDWTFEVFSPDWVSTCIDEGDFYNVETPKGRGFFSLSMKHAKGNVKTLNYVSHEDLEEVVLAYAIENAIELGFESFCYMAYNDEKDDTFKKIGLETYNDQHQDVYVFEKKGRD